MRRRFRKFVVYLLAVMIVMPSLSISGLFKAEEASAKDVTKYYDDSGGVSIYSEYDSSNWSVGSSNGRNSSSRYTSGAQPTEFATWSFTPSVTGDYTVDVSWLVHSSNSTIAKYIVKDKNGNNPAVSVDQTLNNNGIWKVDNTKSGYRNIGTYQFIAGQSYSVKLLGDSSDQVYADAIRIEHDNVISEKPDLITPTDTSMINTLTPLLDWTDSLDEDGDTVTYELLIDSTNVFSTPLVNKTVSTSTDISSSQYSVASGEITLDGTYYWYIRAWDGYDYSVNSAIQSFTIDTVNPIIIIIGGNEVIEMGDVYTDKGATAIDNIDGPITGDIVSVDPVDTSVVGIYTVTYDVSDAAGNPATQVTRTVEVEDTVAPASPVIIVSQGGNKVINVSWDAVGGASFYYVFVGSSSGASYVSKTTVFGTTHPHSVSDYGTYYVRVVAVDGSGNESLESDSVTMQKFITLSGPAPAPVVRKASVSTSVAPEPAEAVDSIPTVVEETTDDTVLDEDGVIKGDEGNDEEEEINWTPWIILFILIILAGAATGGYFYWFGDDEKVQTSVKENSKKSSPAPKAKTSAKKKPRRW